MSKMSSADDKRLRREIANSNERRRMQSINAGFIALRQLLPLSEGEKLSKAAILQLTAKYINVLSQEKSRLLQQNNKLKEQLQQQQATSSCAYAPPSRPSTTDESATTDAPLQSPVGCKEPHLRKLQPRALAPPTVPEREPPVTNVAHEVTVGSDVSSLPFKSQQVSHTSTATTTTTANASLTLMAPNEAAQMNLPLRKRKRTYSLSVEPSAVPSTSKLSDGHSLLSVNSCPRQADADANANALVNDDADTDADGHSAAPSTSTCRTLPTADSDGLPLGIGIGIDRLRFVPSAPKNEPAEASPATPQTPLGAYPAMANPVMLGSAAPYGGAMLVSANTTSQPRNALFTSPPFRFDMITSVQPAGGVPLLLSTPTRQRFDSVSFTNVNLEPPVPTPTSVSASACAPTAATALAPTAPPSVPSVRQTCESSTSITKKNLETIFEAIRHVEGDDLMGETPCRQQRPAVTESQSPVSGASTMLVPFGDAPQPQTAFLVCLSPAMALSPSHPSASASGDYCKSPVALAQNAVQFSMNTVISPVSVAGSAPRFAQTRVGQSQLVVNAAGTDYEAISSYSSSGSVRSGPRAPVVLSSAACESVLSSTYNPVS